MTISRCRPSTGLNGPPGRGGSGLTCGSYLHLAGESLKGELFLRKPFDRSERSRLVNC